MTENNGSFRKYVFSLTGLDVELGIGKKPYYYIHVVVELVSIWIQLGDVVCAK
jgi:hypothetical protein